MTETIEQVARRVVDEFTSKGLLFTALDVSNSVKQALPGVRHREVSPLVRDLFTNKAMGDDYLQSMIDVDLPGGKSAQAYLYHLDEDDPEMYTESQRKQNAIPPIKVSEKDDAVIDPSIKELDLKMGRDGRLRLPKKFLENVGIDTDDVTVHQLGMGPGLILTSGNADQHGSLAVLQYQHPSLLHIPRRLVYTFDTDKPITAKIIDADEAVHIEATAKPDNTASTSTGSN